MCFTIKISAVTSALIISSCVPHDPMRMPIIQLALVYQVPETCQIFHIYYFEFSSPCKNGWYDLNFIREEADKWMICYLPKTMLFAVTTKWHCWDSQCSPSNSSKSMILSQDHTSLPLNKWLRTGNRSFRNLCLIVSESPGWINLLRDYWFLIMLPHHFIYKEIETWRKAMICPTPHSKSLNSSHDL